MNLLLVFNLWTSVVWLSFAYGNVSLRIDSFKWRNIDLTIYVRPAFNLRFIVVAAFDLSGDLQSWLGHHDRARVLWHLSAAAWWVGRWLMGDGGKKRWKKLLASSGLTRINEAAFRRQVGASV